MMRISELCLYAGILLLPFAYGSVESGTPILSIGLPILLIPSLIGLMWVSLGNGAQYKFPIWVWSFVLFSLMAVASCILSPQFGPALYRALVNIQIVGLIMYVYLLCTLNNPRLIYFRLLYMLVGSGTLLALEYIGHFIYKGFILGFGPVIADRVVGGAAALNWGASNTVAGCLLITSLLSLALAVVKTEIKHHKALMYLAFAIQVLGIGFTFSRTVLGILAMFSLLVVFSRKQMFKAIAFLIVFSGLVVVATMIFANLGEDGWETLIQNRFDIDTLTTMSGRTQIWREYLQRVADSGGMPYGYFSAIYLNEVSGHNNFLTLFFELGWIGGIVFTLLVLMALVKAFRAPPALHWAAVTAAIANMMTEDLIYLQVYSIYFWIMLALVYIWHGSRTSSTDADVRKASPSAIPKVVIG